MRLIPISEPIAIENIQRSVKINGIEGTEELIKRNWSLHLNIREYVLEIFNKMYRNNK